MNNHWKDLAILFYLTSGAINFRHMYKVDQWMYRSSNRSIFISPQDWFLSSIIGFWLWPICWVVKLFLVRRRGEF